MKTLSWMGVLLCVAASAYADSFAGYTQYQYLPKLGQIRINDGLVRGKPYVDMLPSQAKALEKNGIFPEYAKEQKTYLQRDQIGTHQIDTVLTVYPPTGRGHGGGNYTKNIVISIDGKKKVDCSFGYDAAFQDLIVQEIVIFPEDGLIHILASSKGAILELPNDIGFIQNKEVITNESFFKDKSH